MNLHFNTSFTSAQCALFGAGQNPGKQLQMKVKHLDEGVGGDFAKLSVPKLRVSAHAFLKKKENKKKN